MNLRSFVLLVAFSLSACGQTVQPLSLRDPAIPLEARKLLADTQDAVSIARLKRDGALRKRRRVLEWQKDMVEERTWPKDASAAKTKLVELAVARVTLAEDELMVAEKGLALSEAKYTLLIAQTAMRNDLAIYELKPLEDDVDLIRSELTTSTEKLLAQIDKVDKLTSSWWNAYSGFVAKGGNSRVFYLSSAKEPVLPPIPKKPEPKEGEAPPKDGDKAPKKKIEEF